MTENNKYSLAKDFTELAIQNGLFTSHADVSDTAKEVTTFFNTIIDTIEKGTGNEH